MKVYFFFLDPVKNLLKAREAQFLGRKDTSYMHYAGDYCCEHPTLHSVRRTPTLTCLRFAPWRQFVFASWCTTWKALHICGDFIAEGRMIQRLLSHGQCCLGWGARRLDWIWNGISLWHGLLRVAPGFQDRGKLPRDPAVAVWPFMTELPKLCGITWPHSSWQSKLKSIQIQRGRKKPPTQSHKRKIAAINRTAAYISTNVVREILESWILKTKRDPKGLYFHPHSGQLSLQLSLGPLPGPLQVFPHWSTGVHSFQFVLQATDRVILPKHEFASRHSLLPSPLHPTETHKALVIRPTPTSEVWFHAVHDHSSC